jgi:hypothetical protein
MITRSREAPEVRRFTAALCSVGIVGTIFIAPDSVTEDLEKR